MPVEITITRSPGNVNVVKSSHSFSEEGGTLGRGSNNAWVLDDPDKYMSSTHTQIGYENGQFVLTDISTNGTFINGSDEPLGHGNKISLNDGTRFGISDYEFSVSIVGAGNSDVSNDIFSQPVGEDPFSAGIPDNNPIESFTSDPFQKSDPFGSSDNQSLPVSDAISEFDHAEMDPLAVLDKSNSNSNQPTFNNNQIPESSFDETDFGGAGFGDSGSVASGAIDWPNANIENGMIPDDWDSDDLMSSEPSPSSTHSAAPNNSNIPVSAPVSRPVPNNNLGHIEPAAQSHTNHANSQPAVETVLKSDYEILEAENKKLMSDIVKLKLSIKKYKAQNNENRSNETKKATSPRVVVAQDQTLIESMGLSKWNLEDDKIVQISGTVGLMVRETMEGMMRVLKFRKKIKEEFRINVTTIQPIENNPLKFSANIDDAMENMFIKENNAYKEPIAALKEGFQGVAEHQVAVLAGMQAAFRGMLDRLDPLNLEKRFEKYKKSGLISLGQKGKNWESYKEYHKGLIDNLDDSFQHLFGYDFVQAYEDQMQRLVSSRLSNKKL